MLQVGGDTTTWNVLRLLVSLSFDAVVDFATNGWAIERISWTRRVLIDAFYTKWVSFSFSVANSSLTYSETNACRCLPRTALHTVASNFRCVKTYTVSRGQRDEPDNAQLTTSTLCRLVRFLSLSEQLRQTNEFFFERKSELLKLPRTEKGAKVTNIFTLLLWLERSHFQTHLAARCIGLNWLPVGNYHLHFHKLRKTLVS